MELTQVNVWLPNRYKTYTINICMAHLLPKINTNEYITSIEANEQI